MSSKPKVVIITGTPGTGKSTLAKILQNELHYDYLDFHQYYKQLAIIYNKEKQCYDLDYKKVLSLVKQKIKTTKKIGIIIDSHVAHHMPKSLVDLCIVLTCSNLKVLGKCLRQRRYSKKKIRENLDAEIFQVCLTESREQGHKIVTFDTSEKNTKEIAKILIEQIKYPNQKKPTKSL